MVEVEIMQLVDVGLVVVVVEEVEMVGGRAEEIRVEGEVMEATGETASIELRGGDVVSVTDETKVTELEEVTRVGSLQASVAELAGGISDGEEAVVVTEIAASPPAAAAGVA